MNQFTQRNAIMATVLNLIINTVAPFIIFFNDAFINLKGENPTLISMLMPTVMISVLTMSKQRMAHKLEPTLDIHTRWLPTALLTSIGLGLIFTGLCFGLLWLLQSSMANVQIPKLPALLISGVLGAFVAFITSFIAVSRARLIH